MVRIQSLAKNTPHNASSHSPEQIETILNQASQAFEYWKNVSMERRSSLMFSFAAALEENMSECAELISEEMGKVIKQSRQEIGKCALTARFYAEKGKAFLAPEIVKSDFAKSYISYHPLGPILAVMPWNFPFWQVIRFAAPALMAGNTAVLKHASNVPGCALMIEKLFRNAGFDHGIFQTILIEGKNMDTIVGDSRIKAVTLTGSEGAGSRVAEISGKNIKKTVLELGGSDPFIILEDANIELAVEMAVNARMVNTGQSCIAAKRFIVVDKVASKFITAFQDKMSNLKMGDPFDVTSDYGPLAKLEFAASLHDQVHKSVELGAQLILGGVWTEANGPFYPATILVDVKPGMPAYEQELFGPVAAVIKVKDDEEAIRVANDTRFGLGASVWTQDVSRGESCAARIEAGMVCINKMVASDPHLPFGGIKASGYGRELSYLGIREFTNIKSVVVG